MTNRQRVLATLCTVCVVLNSFANIAAPYLLRPIINVYIPNKAADSLVRAVILLGEPLTAAIVLGMVLVTGGLLLSQ